MPEYAVGDRVTHVDQLAQDGTTLPMAGSVVAVQIRYLVQWDGEERRPMTGWTPTHLYPAESLAKLTPPGETA